MVNPIRRILLKHPNDAYQNQDKLNKQSPQLHYFGVPNFEKAISDYDTFVGFLESCDIEIHYLPKNDSTSLDSIYTHDPCVISNGGVILCTMGKDARVPESKAMESYFRSIGVPILGHIESPGTLEGGDVVWVDERTVAVGEGYRTNAEGIRQFKALLGHHEDEVISVPLPHWTGPADCLHLMSNVSPIDHNLYLVYSRLLPVSFRQYLLNRQIKLVEVPDEEYETMGCNVLAVAPRKVIMLKGNPITQKRLEAEGVDIHTYDGTEISLKGAGGPTCLTRPFLRLAK
ncbi:MAG: amidinotransferase [Candidatus Marinimicrobia bacterium]|nr:amidinotransferase [Candidatus Neomarinimicrobiota bacterium]MBL7010314.1 amidinotransferase [Candidatus Neomarinimicrobiota bacterium]MBL7030569.1 amidinotransferase [Candidatus Neomarinimicrobiota bacterium]